MRWASLGEQEGDAICTGRLTVAPEGPLLIPSQAREEVKRLEQEKRRRESHGVTWGGHIMKVCCPPSAMPGMFYSQ